jgi:hypothetical protein
MVFWFLSLRQNILCTHWDLNECLLLACTYIHICTYKNQLKYGISSQAAETASTVHTLGASDRNAYTRHGMHKPIAGVGKPTSFTPGIVSAHVCLCMCVSVSTQTYRGCWQADVVHLSYTRMHMCACVNCMYLCVCMYVCVCVCVIHTHTHNLSTYEQHQIC